MAGTHWFCNRLFLILSLNLELVPTVLYLDLALACRTHSDGPQRSVRAERGLKFLQIDCAVACGVASGTLTTSPSEMTSVGCCTIVGVGRPAEMMRCVSSDAVMEDAPAAAARASEK
jgi:hypothetical protein